MIDITVRDKKELEFLYLLIREPMLPDEQAVYLKRIIRKYTHRESDRRIVHENGIDGFTVLIRFPEDIATRDEAERWFDSEERRTYRPSAYDCTGQAFTMSHTLANRRGRWYCYHTVGFDV
jgi:antibiotic biosynthesis monooxygenase (ABM) superfamily enzyme